MLVTVLCDQYLSEYARFKKSKASDRSIINCHIRPVLGALAVAELRFAHINRIHAGLAEHPYQANRVLSLLSKMLNLAELWELRPEGSNPCGKVKRYRERRRVRFLSDVEVKAVISALETRLAGWPLEAGLLLLLLYTGARRGEMMQATWKDLRDTELYLPDSKNGSERLIYLTPQALAIVDLLPRRGPWLIGPQVNARYAWAAVLKETGIKNMRIHDLRHCFASLGVTAQQSLETIGGLLGHASLSATSIYSHLVPSHGRAAAIAIGEQFNRIAAP